jgi:hypothetical protein
MLIIELSVLDYSLNYFLSSQIAAAAIHFTIQVHHDLLLTFNRFIN